MLHHIIRHWFLAVTLGLSIVLVFGGSLWAFFSLRTLGGPLIIHYTSRTGIDQIGSLGDIECISLFATILLIVNGSLALVLERREPFLGKLVAAGTVALAILIFIWFWAIIRVN